MPLGFDMKVKFGIQPNHILFLGIQWLVRWNEKGEKKSRRTRKELYVTSMNIVGDVEQVTTEDILKFAAVIVEGTELTKEEILKHFDEGQLTRLQVTFKTEPLLACNLVAEDRHGEFNGHIAALNKVLSEKSSLQPS
jgi:hypothetical protein